MAELIEGPLTLADAPVLLTLFHTYDRRFFGEPLMDSDDLLSDLQSPEFDLTTDSRAFRTPAALASGFGSLYVVAGKPGRHGRPGQETADGALRRRDDNPMPAGR